MARITRAISADGSVMAMAIDSTDIANRIEQIHKTSAVVTAATGRLATAAAMMGWMLKGEKDSLTLRLAGGGPSGTILAVSDAKGNVKACPQNPVVELPLNAKGKLDVAGAVGRDGYLAVIRDLGLKEPYVGQVAVGAVVLNRVDHPSFPNSISGVIYQPGAFSCMDDGQFDQPIAESAYRAAQEAINGYDPSYGAIYYFNPNTATSDWIWSRPLIVTIGNHRFCA